MAARGPDARPVAHRRAPLLRSLSLPRPEHLLMQACRNAAGLSRTWQPESGCARIGARRQWPRLPLLAANRGQQRLMQIVAGACGIAADNRAPRAVATYRLRTLACAGPDDAGQGAGNPPRRGAGAWPYIRAQQRDTAARRDRLLKDESALTFGLRDCKRLDSAFLLVIDQFEDLSRWRTTHAARPAMRCWHTRCRLPIACCF